MKQIQPVNTWVNGVNKSANYIDLKIESDDLSYSAIFFFQLKEIYIDENQIEQKFTITSGYISISGIEYQNWGTNVDVNTDAYNIAASKLNLTLI